MKRVWVTRDEAPGGDLSAALRSHGLEPVVEPVLERRIADDMTAALSTLGPRDWLVLTSRYAIEAIPAAEVRARVAVVGEPSRRAAEARGLRVERTGPDGTAASLWRSLRRDAGGAARLLHPRSDLADAPPDVPGVAVLSPVLYETRPREFDLAIVQRVDAAALTSPSAASAVARAPGLPPCASIGPTTTAAMLTLGIRVWLESPSPSFDRLAGAIAAKLGE